MSPQKHFAIALLWLSAGVSLNKAVLHELEVHPNFTMTYEIKASVIEFACKIKWATWSHVWCQIGFELKVPSTLRVINADYLVGTIRYEHFECNDYHLPYAKNTMQLDKQQDQDCIKSAQDTNQNVSTMIFSRRLYTYDDFDYEIKDETIYLLWAYNGDDGNSDKPTASGAIEINLVTGVVPGGAGQISVSVGALCVTLIMITYYK